MRLLRATSAVVHMLWCCRAQPCVLLVFMGCEANAHSLRKLAGFHSQRFLHSHWSDVVSYMSIRWTLNEFQQKKSAEAEAGASSSDSSDTISWKTPVNTYDYVVVANIERRGSLSFKVKAQQGVHILMGARSQQVGFNALHIQPFCSMCESLPLRVLAAACLKMAGWKNALSHDRDLLTHASIFTIHSLYYPQARVLEIMHGGPDNDHSEVHYGMRGGYVLAAANGQFLDGAEFREFWLQWDEATLTMGQVCERHELTGHARLIILEGTVASWVGEQEETSKEGSATLSDSLTSV